jgi:hypothetical protein
MVLALSLDILFKMKISLIELNIFLLIIGAKNMGNVDIDMYKILLLKTRQRGFIKTHMRAF